VPARRRDTPGSLPADRSILRIPQAQAEAELTQRINFGKNFLGRYTLTAGHINSLRAEVEQWRDYNRTWLNKNIGGEAADEYRTASTHSGSAATPSSPDTKLNFLRREVRSEVSKLQSIYGRLRMWTQEDAAGSAVRASPDAPIFIVHGSDTLRAESVARTVGKATGRQTIILREQPNLGRTLMEKFEQHAAEASYAVIVLTADDQGCRASETETRLRGRQNVILEMGYFFALLGRDRVSVLIQAEVEKPSDMDGIVYIAFDDEGTWKNEIYRELQHSGFDVQM
jgi:predicted nucleotide-binding protein